MSSAAEAVRSSEAVRPSEEQPWLIFFHSKLDGRSRRVEAFLAQVLQRRKNHQTFVRYEVDVDERPEVAERFGVDEVPTLVVVADRRVQARLARPRGCTEIDTILGPWMQGARNPNASTRKAS